MKNNLILALSFFFLLSAFYSYSQVPQKFNYQGIARDTKGNPMAQQRMTLKLSVLPTADAIEGEYEEIQTVSTNEFGLYTLQIGNGTPITGSMKTVTWETGNKYIKVAIDPKGGNDFVDAGTSQLLSVPYAIYADKAGMAKTASGDRTGAVNSAASHVAGDANYLAKFTGLNVIGKSQLYENGINIGIGTTTPASRLHLYSNVVGVQQHLRMQNASPTGAGRFTMYNDTTSSYATFSKYGTAYAGGYTGIPTLYPYANLLAFGNNGIAANDGLGRFLISSGGNVGVSIFKGGTSKLKFHADYATENVGIGGNAAPVSRVHLNNTDGTSMDVRLTNTTTGHTATDGLTLTMSGNNARITNRENAFLVLGTNDSDRVAINGAGNVGIGTVTPSAKLDINGQLKIQGGTPGIGKVLTSDATGMASWKMPGADSQWARSGENIFNKNSGMVGIGTNSPSGKLHVVSSYLPNGITYNGSGPNNLGVSTDGFNAADSINYCVRIASGTVTPNTVQTSTDGGMTWSAPFNATASISLANGIVSTLGTTGNHATGDQWCFTVKKGMDILVTKERNVGIGTITPQNRLDVEGGVAIGSSYSGSNTAPMDGAIIQGNVGIGTSSPTTKLDVNGQIKIQGGNPGVGKVLTSDANGLATWKKDTAKEFHIQNIMTNGVDIPHGVTTTLITSNTNWDGGKKMMIQGSITVGMTNSDPQTNTPYGPIFASGYSIFEVTALVYYNNTIVGASRLVLNGVPLPGGYEHIFMTMPINVIVPGFTIPNVPFHIEVEQKAKAMYPCVLNPNPPYNSFCPPDTDEPLNFQYLIHAIEL